jgi:hypothetical protein
MFCTDKRELYRAIPATLVRAHSHVIQFITPAARGMCRRRGAFHYLPSARSAHAVRLALGIAWSRILSFHGFSGYPFLRLRHLYSTPLACYLTDIPLGLVSFVNVIQFLLGCQPRSHKSFWPLPENGVLLELVCQSIVRGIELVLFRGSR